MSRMIWPNRSDRDCMPWRTHGGDCIRNYNQICEQWYIGTKKFPNLNIEIYLKIYLIHNLILGNYLRL